METVAGGRRTRSSQSVHWFSIEHKIYSSHAEVYHSGTCSPTLPPYPNHNHETQTKNHTQQPKNTTMVLS